MTFEIIPKEAERYLDLMTSRHILAAWQAR